MVDDVFDFIQRCLGWWRIHLDVFSTDGDGGGSMVILTPQYMFTFRLTSGYFTDFHCFCVCWIKSIWQGSCFVMVCEPKSSILCCLERPLGDSMQGISLIPRLSFYLSKFVITQQVWLSGVLCLIPCPSSLSQFFILCRAYSQESWPATWVTLFLSSKPLAVLVAIMSLRRN